MDLEFVDIDTQDPYRWHRTVFCKDLLCISGEEGPEASVSNHKTRNIKVWASCYRQRTKYGMCDWCKDVKMRLDLQV